MKRLLLIFGIIPLFCQSQTIGLLQNDTAVYDGYTLLNPLPCPAGNCGTYLINTCGEVVNQWPTDKPTGLNAYLLPNGNLLRAYAITHPFINAGGRGGGVQIWDFEGNLLWDYQISNATEAQHHEILPMPNGNILAMLWSYKDSVTCYNNGRDTAWLSGAGLWSDKIVEIQPIFPDSGVIVWQWDNWDHMFQNRDTNLINYDSLIHPELFDINYLGWSAGGKDWFHMNAIDYNEDLDQIAMSSRYFHEIYIIDHSTSIAEAASHSGGNSGKGGDVLYRWGNPEAYGKGTLVDKRLFAQHNVHWIKNGLTDAGKLMIFNNGTSRTPIEYSSVDIINPNPDINGNYSLNINGVYGPDTAEWSYVAPNPTDFHAQYISGAQRLENGNTFICDGTHGTMFEINSSKEILWKYISPVSSVGILSQGNLVPVNGLHGTDNWVFRAPKYGVNFPGFVGKTFTNTGPLELNPIPNNCLTKIEASANEFNIKIYPNPSNGIVYIELFNPTELIHLEILNLIGNKVFEDDFYSSNYTLDLEKYSRGMYFVKVSTKDFSSTKKIILE